MRLVPEGRVRWSLVTSTLSATGRITHRCSNESINRNPKRYEESETEHLGTYETNNYGCKTTLIYVYYAPRKFNETLERVG